MRTIGLTGRLGSGKSTVARILARHGAHVIDADRVGHEVYLPGTQGWREVVGAFGREILAPDGTVDRKKLGELVFRDPEALARLNRIVHPLIGREIERRLRELRETGRRLPAVVEAAVLVEAGWTPLVDEVWLVTTTPDLAVRRVGEQRGWSPAEVRARLEAQLPEEDRLPYARVVIPNTGSLEELEARVLREWRRVAEEA
ncbi:MAG: dephospho-CoA kinase [Candidatus Binatia bacterium]|nr:MAG: dephospho-CoA kinase [Candidatus Binatia bacterium]